jgi:hypothetical protein
VFNKPTEVDVEVDQESLRIRFLIDDRTKVVALKAIANIFSRTPRILEVWTAKNRSFLLTAHRSPHPLAELVTPVKLDEEWRSNFDYLLWLNRVSGRSFHDHSCYPVFPSFLSDFTCPTQFRSPSLRDFSEPKLLSELQDIGTELQRSCHVVPDFDCFPEAIRLPLPEWAVNSHEFVYRMRKLLERKIVSSLLPSWIGGVWGPGRPKSAKHLQLFPATFPTKRQQNTKTERCRRLALTDCRIVFAFHYLTELVVLNGKGELFILDYGEGPLNLAEQSTIEISNDVEFYQDRSNLLVFDRSKGQMLRGGDIRIQSNLYVAVDDDYFFCPGPFEIRNSKKVICRSNARITSFAVNMTFQRLVYSRCDGKVCFVQLMKGSEIQSISLNDAIDSILITQRWGFVVLKSSRSVFVCSVNGVFLKSKELKSRIRSWKCFASFEGFDLVAFAAESGEVGYLEAFLPAEQKVLHQCPEVMDLVYDLDGARMFVVERSGSVEVIPHALPPIE